MSVNTRAAQQAAQQARKAGLTLTHKQSAIVAADAELRVAGLPTYSELAAALRKLHKDCVEGIAPDGYVDLCSPGRSMFNEAAAILGRIPAIENAA